LIRGRADTQDEKDEKSGEPSGTGTPAPKKKAAEPSSFTLGNMTRVTPQQLASISFPESSRFVPLRPLNERISSDDKKTAGPQAMFGRDREQQPGSKEQRAVAGSIVLLRGTQPETKAEYIELNRALWPSDAIAFEPESAPTPPPAAAAAGAGGAGGAAGGAIEEAEAPPAFEYPFDD
jgi:26S proteasome regulatory subunit N2